MKIAVIGTGYVGLVSGTCFAETGNTVFCVDIDESKVKKLASGQITIYEPGLEKLFLRNIKEDRLHFTTSIDEVIDQVEVVFLALPTPPGADGAADLKYVLGVVPRRPKAASSRRSMRLRPCASLPPCRRSTATSSKA